MLKKELIYPEIYNPKLSWHVMPDDMEYISILQEQGVSNFDPIAFYREANWQKSQEIKIDESKLSKKDRKELKKKNYRNLLKKLLMIILEKRKKY